MQLNGACTLLHWLCCSVYKAQFLKRMGRLLDNLPEKDITTAIQCTTPSVQSASASLRETDSADSVPRILPLMSNATKATSVPSLALCSDSKDSSSASSESMPRDVTSSVSTSSQLQTSVSNTDQSHVSTVPTSYHPSTCLTAQSGLHTTSRGLFYNISSTSQEPSYSQSPSVRQLPHSRLDITVTRDILPPCIGLPNSSRGGLSCVTVPSSSGRGGLSAYDTSSHRVHLASVEGLDVSRPTTAPDWYGQSLMCNRSLISSDRQQTPTTTGRSAAAHSDWVTTRQ